MAKKQEDVKLEPFGLEMPNTSIFSLGATTHDPVSNLPGFDEHTIPASLNSADDAFINLFNRNPNFTFTPVKELEWSKQEPIIEAFNRLKTSPDFKLFHEYCLEGYLCSLFRKRQEEKDIYKEAFKCKEIQDKARVVFGVMNNFFTTCKLVKPEPAQTINKPLNEMVQ